MTEKIKNSPLRRIQVFFFAGELFTAVALCVGCYNLCHITRIRYGVSLPTDLLSTLVALWIIKSSLEALNSLRIGTNPSQNDSFDFVDDSQNDQLIDYHQSSCGNNTSKVAGDTQEEDEGVPTATVANIESDTLLQTKKILESEKAEIRDATTTKVHLPTLAFFATAFLQFAVRVFVIAQNLRRKLRIRETSRNNIIQISDVPFTIGKKMCTAGCPFFIFTFLNGLVRSGENDDLSDDNAGVFVDNNITFRAVSIEQICIGSSYGLVRSTREMESGDDPVVTQKMNQQSWLQLVFGGIEMCFIIHLKRKRRKDYAGGKTNAHEVGSHSDSGVHQIAISISIESIKFGVFPEFADSISLHGMEMNIDTTINTDASSPSLLGASDLHDEMCGAGMSASCHLLNLRRFQIVNSYNSSSSDDRPHSKVTSWSRLKSSFHIRRKISSKIAARQVIKSHAVASLSLPDGFVVTRQPKKQISETSYLKPTSVSFGNADEYCDGIFCNNLLAVGVDLKELRDLAEALEAVLLNIASSICPTLSSGVIGKGSFGSQSRKTKSKIEIVELSSNCCFRLSAILPPSHLKETKQRNRLSLNIPSALIQLKKNRFTEFQKDAISGLNKPYSNGKQGKADKSGNHSTECVIGAKSINMCFEVCGYDDLGKKHSSALELLAVHQISMKLTDLHDISPSRGLNDDELPTKSVTVNIGRAVVRLNGDVITQLAFANHFLESTKIGVRRLQCSVNQVKESISPTREEKSSVQGSSTKQNALDIVYVSCDCIDVAIDLPSGHKEIQVDESNDDGRVRLALLQRSVEMNVSRCMEIQLSTFIDVDDMLESDLRSFGEYYFIKSAISKLEASVVFFPHSSLPTTEIYFSDACPPYPKNNETEFYGHASKVLMETFHPMKKSVGPPDSSSKVLAMKFCDLSAFERCAKKVRTEPSLFATSVYGFSFDHKRLRSGCNDWPMMERYAPASLTKIVQCNGSFCSVDKEDVAMGHKSSTIFIQVYETKTSELELFWSPILQWLQTSCNYRIQGSLSSIKSMVREETKDTGISHQKHSRILIRVDPSSRANMHVYFGSKSAMHTTFDGGLDMTVSMTKHMNDAARKAFVSPMKPNITLQAQHVTFLFNGIEEPVFEFDGVYFENTIRRAHDDEIAEYLEKTNRSIYTLSEFVATDHEGHPLKEIFELKFGSFAAMRFPPTLHFGEVIDDFVLTPRALDLGMNKLKGVEKKGPKKYQLMSIKCDIPFLDVALLNDDNDSRRYLFGEDQSQLMDHQFLRDEFRLCFESVKLSVKRNTPPEIVQHQISALDEDLSSTFRYGPAIQGGELLLTIGHIVSTLRPLNIATPLLRINGLDMKGFLYLAGISPSTPGVTKGKHVTSALFCHHNCILVGENDCCCTYGISYYSAGIPVKLYTDCKVCCQQLEVSYGPVMNPSIPRFMECLQRILPPPPKSTGAPPTPLSWWDNLRFLVHGHMCLSLNTLSLRWLLDAHTFRDQSILFECEKCVIKHDIGTFDLNAADVNVSIPGTAYDMSCHPSKMDRTVISALLPSDADSIVGTHRHPLIYVPELKSKISFTWNMFAHGSRDSFHHSPYLIHYHKLDGSNCIEGDKFAPFRSDGVSVNFDFDLPGGDSCANWVALRIDVLPWFTHLNSTVDFSPADDKKPEPFPRFRSVAIKVIVNELKIATWFAENEDGDDEDTEELGGVCLIVNMVSYIATIEGSKEIKIEGPVKSALLDFCDLKTEAETEFDQLSKVELMAASFGSPMGNSNQVEHSNFGSKTCLVLDDKPLFMKLEELSREIDELDYLFITGQIDIQNKSLERILSGSDEIHRDSIDSANRKGLAVVDKSTWSILVSRLKLLWTLKIRDALMAITQDLIFTIGFMKSQIRQTQLLAESALTQHDFDGNSSNHRYSSPADSAGEGVELSLRDTLSTSSESAKSKLHYLLERDSGFEVNIANDGGHFVDRGKAEKTDLETVPTIDIHFSNPQVQLHSKTTGGSVILAMEGAHIEGRKFVKFLVTKPLNKTGKVFPRDLIRKTEHAYSLTNMEAFALSTHIDVNAGLPWLEICTPGDRNVTEAVILEERYGIADNISEFLTNAKSADIDSNSSRDDPVSICDNSSSDRSHHFIYPESLRHHEPLAFSKTGILRPILDKFTFQSRQVFHRPPVHYSTEELHSFINQGLVHTQNETAVDHIELQIDLLLFNLDSYQFKTTIDLIRNVLLEPPKPYRRHLQREKFDHIESQSNDPKPSNRISSVAATEMEDAIGKIASDDKHLGRKEREALRSSAMALQRDLEDRLTLSGDDITRRIVYTLNQLKWSIQCPDEIDDVEIAFTGFHGQHDYSANGSVLSQFGLEDVRVSSSKPGPDSICFLDPTSVVKSVLGDERTPCQRCGKKFDHDEDHSNPCQYHPGTFKSQIWTCCESADAHSLGCKSGPHTGKERAAMVRVQALPRSVEGITLYSHFEVNIFPSVPHTLVLQISKSLSRLFMAYFFVGNDGKEDVETMSTISEGTGSTEGASMYPENTPKQPVRRSLIVGGKPSPPSGGKSIRGEPYQNRTNDYENPSDIEETEKLVEGAEIIFIKVWRVGYVNVNLSLGGFRRLPQTTLDICVPAYSRAYEVGTWSYLGRKFLTFLIKEILKSGASSGLEKVRKKMIRSTTNPDCDHGKPFVEARSSPLASTDYTYLPEDEDFFLRKNLSRPVGAEAILGTPHRGKPKKKRPFGKK